MKRLALLFALACSPAPDPTTADPGDQGVPGWVPVFMPAPERASCSDGRLGLVRSPGPDPVAVDCHLTLDAADVITHPLAIVGEGGSGVRIDCNGATLAGPGDSLQIRSRILEGTLAEPVHDVTVSDCVVPGAVRLWGLAQNGEGERLWESSRTLHHAWTVRDAAPYRVTLERITVTSAGRVPVYFGPGVHHSSLRDSEIGGPSVGPLVYLDAESVGNVVARNTLRAESLEREAIAVDGSGNNTIADNAIWSAYQGGIYLYRNCGQGGVIRHTTPSGNHITGNVVQCRRHTLDLASGPGVFLGARDGGRSYCDDDAGWPYGSSVSDYDFARWNVVTGNDLRDCGVEVGNATNHSNTIE